MEGLFFWCTGAVSVLKMEREGGTWVPKVGWARGEL